MKYRLLGFALALVCLSCGGKGDDLYCCTLIKYSEGVAKICGGQGYADLTALGRTGNEEACKSEYERIRDKYGCTGPTHMDHFYEPPEALAECAK
jgi:hypothetical protein